MMSKLITLLTAIMALALTLGAAGCGGDEQQTPTPAPTSTPAVTPTPTPEPITLKLVFSEPADSPSGQSNYRFAELVEQYTDGRVVIDIYPGSQLFPATEMWEAVVTGAIDIFSDSSYYISQTVPDVMIFYMDGLFESYEHAYAVMEDSEVPQILAEKIEEAGPVKTLALLPGAMTGCVLNSVRETKELEDLKGLRTQSSPGAPPMPLYDYSGMVAVPISFEETSAAFTQGILDAVHFPPTAITDLRLYETGKHMLCRTAWFFTGALLMTNDSWESLPADIQDIILNKVIPEIYEFNKTLFRQDEEDAMELIKQNVETVNWVTQEDLDPYYEYMQTHPVNQVQLLMVDPRIIEIIQELQPSRQQQ